MTLRLPILALFSRSLRVESRAGGTYLKRTGLLALILVTLMIAHAASGFTSAPGLAFFTYLLYINVIFISLGMLTYFASAITEEKEDDTLGLLRMTSLNTAAILLGKSTSRLLGALMLLLVQLPFTLLAITLGGVSMAQIVAAYATLLAYTIFLANLALFCSVAAKRTPQATGLTFFLLGAFLLSGPLGLRWLLPSLMWYRWLSPLGATLRTLTTVVTKLWEANPFVQLSTITSVGFAESPFSYQVGSNLVLGLCFFVLAWLAFGFFTREDRPPSQARGIIFRRSSPLRWLGIGRPWRQAIAWKDFHFLAGGRLMVLARFLAIPLFLALIFRLTDGWRSRPTPWDTIGTVTMVTALVAAAIEVLGHVARMFQEEVKWGTLPRLMLVPFSTQWVAYAKCLGLLPALVPYAVFFVIGALLNPRYFGQLTHDLLGTVPGWFSIIQYIAFLHFVAFLSLVFRRAGAIVALGGWIVGNILLFAIVRPDSDAAFHALCIFVSLVLISFTIILHVRTLARLEHLAGQ